jgi:glycosyltransferase involved in cell wall biosynthesis
MPMLNEAAHIEQVVADVAAQDFDGEVEVFVADGGSTDGSVQLLEAAAARLGVDVTVLDNPRRKASSGLNVCIPRATGDLIVRLDCHSHYPPEYLRLCAEVADESGAWNVGGVVVPRGRTPTERAVACGMLSPFGGIAWTRNADRRHDADTLSFGAFRPVVFETVGLYDEEIAITEVEELNTRIRRAGGRIVYDPRIKPYYTPRGTFRSLFVQYFRYGRWKVPVMLKHRQTISGRSLVPFAFVLTMTGLGLASVWLEAARWLLAAALALYATAAVGFAVLALRRAGETWTLLPRVIAVFPIFHVAHGIGMARGWVRAARAQ